jgi:hypothetical protein
MEEWSVGGETRFESNAGSGQTLDKETILQLLNPATPSGSFLAIMEAHRPVDIVIAFSGEEKKLDAA